MSTQIKFCEDCGASNDPDAIFCSNCGTRFSQFQEDMLQSENYTPLPTPNQFSVTTPQIHFNAKPITNIISGVRKFTTDPKNNSVQIMADPSTPSGLPLILLRAILVALVAYLQISLDNYFDAFNRSTFEQFTEDTGLTISQLRDVYEIMIPIMLIIFTLAIWWIGSWIMGKIIRVRLDQNSPLLFDISRSMRQLNAYRQLPIIIAEAVSVISILIFSPDIYISFIWIFMVLGQITFGVLLIQGLQPNTGYHGNFHNILGGLTILVAILSIF